MKNYQRVLFVVLSTIIVVTVFITFKTTDVDIKKENGTTNSVTEFVMTRDYTPLNPALVEEEDTVIEERYVEDVSETKQEIVTEVKSEYGLASEEEIIMLAKVIQAEAGGIPSDTERSCVAWTVLNHVDSSSYPNTIASCITRPGAFAYYSGIQVSDHNLWLARDVVNRWERERAGETDVGRTLPQGYFSFWGDGSHNYFRQNCSDWVYWDYSFGTPYDS